MEKQIKLPKSFYLRNDVVLIAKQLLGKYLFTHLDGMLCGGIITETEAYEGITDKASHAYGGRRTKGTEIMFAEGGLAYVYLIYGIHSLFNVVTNVEGEPHAVLIRAIKPEYGVDEMLKRAVKVKVDKNFANGPGKVSKILGIHYSQSGMSLSSDKIWIEDRGLKVFEKDIKISKRIGIDYAEEDAFLPYRFELTFASHY
ncbi:MAG: DNA-3-methyladenine glycosylase [Saprospiraceae bacterium]|nr:DNA-3-methyladenine glycosylase [Saprospiraceae bacterium]